MSAKSEQKRETFRNELLDYVQKNPFDRSSLQPWERETLAPYVGSAYSPPGEPPAAASASAISEISTRRKART